MTGITDPTEQYFKDGLWAWLTDHWAKLKANADGELLVSGSLDYLPHALLDGSMHNDTVVGAAVKGDTIIGIDQGGGVVKWQRKTGGISIDSGISPTTANVTAAVSTRYFADLSGLTASRSFVLPAAAVGDTIELVVCTGHASYAFLVVGAAGITINGGAAATEWSRLFISGETLKLVASSGTNWQVVVDGRISCKAAIARTTVQIISTVTGTKILHGTVNANVGGMVDIANSRIVIRRGGIYQILSQIYYAPGTATRWVGAVYKNGAQIFSAEIGTYNAGCYPVPIVNNLVTLAAEDYIEHLTFHNQGGNMQIYVAAGAEPFISVEEKL